MLVALVAIGILALLGHLMFWVGVFNKVHATAVPYKLIKAFEKLIYLIVACVPLALVWLAIETDWSVGFSFALVGKHPAAALYLALCLSVFIVGFPAWLAQRLARTPDNLVACTTTVVSVRNVRGELPIGNRTGRLFARIPLNEIFDLHIHEKTLAIPRLSAGLAGLSIAHLSDLHFTGHIDRSFFDEVVDRANAMRPDLTVITGDIVDKVPCLEWIRPCLGRLRAAQGVYFILGNHDQRLPDVSRLRRELVDSGLVDLGGRTLTIKIRNERVVLAGNELPWFRHDPALLDQLLRRDDDALRLLLSHSPDQIEWGRKYEFDLILAGHTHGGQIRFPWLGPVVAPSRFGVRYASGLFVEGNTVMQVSRGISGLDPIRINCPPELSKIILQRRTS